MKRDIVWVALEQQGTVAIPVSRSTRVRELRAEVSARARDWAGSSGQVNVQLRLCGALLDDADHVSDVVQCFRAPADGFLSDGLLGLGLGIKDGVLALLLGAATGFYESLQRMSGAFARLSGIDLDQAKGGGRGGCEAPRLRPSAGTANMAGS